MVPLSCLFTRSEDDEECAGGIVTTGVTADKEDIVFGESINGTDNPITFSFREPYEVRVDAPS